MKQFYALPVMQNFFSSMLLFMLGLIATNTNAQCIYFKKLSSGSQSVHSLGLAKDGTLWGWGSNQFGQVGNNSLVNVPEPVQISSTTGWKEIATGDGHSLAIDAEGKLWGWGHNNQGQLGDAQASGTGNVLTPVRIHSSDSIWKAIAACSSHSAGITANGRLWVWGYGTFYDVGGTVPTSPKQVGNDTDWVAITTGSNHFIAIKKDSTLWGWGRNGEGEAGDSTTTNNDFTPPVKIDSSHTWVAIAAGANHTLALQGNGSLWSWGNNTYGELGNGTTNNGLKGPKQVGTAKYIAIGAGKEFSLAVSQDSLRWAWGTDELGQFGNDIGGTGGTHQSLIPVLTDSSKHWVEVYGSEDNSYNLSDDGTVWSAGSNDFQQLGDGNNTTLSNVLIKVGTPTTYPALAISGSSDTEYQRGYNYYATNCSNLITRISKTGGNPIHNITTAKVWIDNAVNNDGAGKPYVQRHYEISPASRDTTATGTVILYFTQEEFTAYNASANVINGTYPKLPIDAADAANYKNNLRINKRMAVSSDGSGTLNSYHGTPSLIVPTSVAYTNGRWQATFDVTGFGGFFATTGATLLPVTWINVNGIINNHNDAEINWKVNELNAAKYDVEKSSDGISFNSIATIASKGNGENTYQHTDNVKVAGSLFYRIKQTDKDGKSNYSTVITLNSFSNNISLSLFPNPATDYLYINRLEQNKTYHVSITDMQGRIVLAKDISTIQNKIFTNALGKGVYIMKITASDTNTSLKFIKQ